MNRSKNTAPSLATGAFVIALGALVAPLTGCATIIQGSHQDVKIRPYPGESHMKLEDSHNQVVYDGKAPATVNLKRSSDYKITVTKDGYEPVTATLQSSFHGSWLAQIFIVGPFLAVDFITGSMSEFDEEGVELTLFRAGQKPAKGTSYDP